ncbi:hypothetical protein F8S13_12145 [Chloroflexia bacterium SDU3-3]|nr:hypothetical protein F8S13_12145 [Chloroflexia bacterium SDU3-3]
MLVPVFPVWHAFTRCHGTRSHWRNDMRIIQSLRATAVAALAIAALGQATPTLAASVAIAPSSYTTTAGSDGGQPVANLATQDQSGSNNNWNKYVEFSPSGSTSYAGYRSYTVPASVALSDVTAIQVQANFLGPAPADQTWTWQIYSWGGSAWATLGTNTGTSWSAWKQLSFSASGTIASYINSSTREIRIRLMASNTSDSADLDYESVTLTTGGASATATPTTAATATRTATAGPTTAATATRTPTRTPTAAATATPTAVYTPIVMTPAPTTAFYVSPSGSDTAAGTQAAPWKSIQKAASSATAGSTVYVRGGTYSERITFGVSGSAGKPITFQSYPGELAVIDGGGLTLSSGDNPLVNLNGKSYIIFKGFELRNNKTSTQGVVPIGIYVPGGSAGVELRNNSIHDIATTYQGTDGGDAHGIAVYGNSSTAITGLVIDGNELYDLKLGSSEALVVNGNVDGFSITKNLVHNTNNIGIDAIGYEGVGPSNDRARNGTIADNRVWSVDSSTNPAYGATCNSGGTVCSGGDTSADGIYVDGGTQIVIERNLVIDANIGIELASEHAGKSTDYITVRNNIVSNVDFAGIAAGGYASSTSGEGGGNAQNNTIVNNTVYTPGKGSAFVAQYRVKNSTLSNNIYAARSGQQRVIGNSASFTGNTEANNLQVTATSASPNPGGLFISVTRPSDSDLRNWSASSVQQFLHIAAGSSAYNAGGSSALSGSTDIDGQARVQGGTIDIGADEAP